MHINILKKDDSYKQHMDKLVEEVKETYEELKYLDLHKEVILKNHLRYAAGEVLDVIQVCVGILDNLQYKGLDIGEAVSLHNKKLMDRGWEIKGIVKIEVEMNDKPNDTGTATRQG